MSDGITFTLKHDTNKTLKAGKRRYLDEEGHNVYLTGEEVQKLEAPDEVEVTIRPKVAA